MELLKTLVTLAKVAIIVFSVFFIVFGALGLITGASYNISISNNILLNFEYKTVLTALEGGLIFSIVGIILLLTGVQLSIGLKNVYSGARTSLSGDQRIIMFRRISGFWEEFSHKKIGVIGLIMLIVYVAVALLAPALTPYDPMSQPRLAQAFAMPEWVTVLPQFQDLTKTKHWPINWQATTGSQYVSGWGTSLDVQYQARNLEPVPVELTYPFSFNQKAPNEFFAKFRFEGTNIKDVEYSLTYSFFTPSGKSYRFWTSPTLTANQAQDVTCDSKDPIFILGVGFKLQENVGRAIFAEKGEYKLVLLLRFRPLTSTAKAQVSIKPGELATLGHVHGVLGTDYLAKDIFAILIYGARLSLEIGLLAALAGTSIGILVGVMSGYLGGAVDEIMMRIVDILICLPLLPLLLALVFLYGRNVLYIVLFIAIFGWQGLARVIRAQTLSIRETAYIDTAKASGASGSYIMLRHIVPNIIPVAFASLVLAVPSAILFEAALSFLGFGDPRVPTWGMLLQNAFWFGAFTQLAWWWIIPPGLAIIGLCLAFVFIGYSFDEVVNPRLRRRR